MTDLSRPTYCGVPFGDEDVARNRPLPMLLVLCVFAWMATWTSLLAMFQATGMCERAADRYPTDLTVAVGLSLFPPTWLVAPMATGFYADGFRVRPRTCERSTYATALGFLDRRG